MKPLQHQLLLGFNIALSPCKNTQHTKADLNHRNIFPINFFSKKIQFIIEENINDETFGIPQLCKTIGISRSQLHNKLKAATGLSTSIFIRSIRLQKAKYLLRTTDFNISEIAYSVGYKDPSYFSKLFIETYGTPPSRFRN